MKSRTRSTNSVAGVLRHSAIAMLTVTLMLAGCGGGGQPPPMISAKELAESQAEQRSAVEAALAAATDALDTVTDAGTGVTEDQLGAAERTITAAENAIAAATDLATDETASFTSSLAVIKTQIMTARTAFEDRAEQEARELPERQAEQRDAVEAALAAATDALDTVTDAGTGVTEDQLAAAERAVMALENAITAAADLTAGELAVFSTNLAIFESLIVIARAAFDFRAEQEARELAERQSGQRDAVEAALTAARDALNVVTDAGIGVTEDQLADAERAVMAAADAINAAADLTADEIASYSTSLEMIAMSLMAARIAFDDRAEANREPETHAGAEIVVSNRDLTQSWYANPQLDLPRHGHDGLQVDRPSHGGAAVPRVVFSPALRDRLEPAWRIVDSNRERLEFVQTLIWRVANQAYLQWTRHLDYDPGVLTVQVGSHGGLSCHNNTTLACYVPDLNVVILDDDWIEENYARLQLSFLTQNSRAFRAVHDQLFFVLTHEAGHQFGYRNPAGITEGCGDETRCHAPYGSGSVVSYDHLQGRSVRYHVTEEDIRHIPNSTWRSDTSDDYRIWMPGDPSSIESWGVGITHYFEVDGRTAPGRLSGGNLSIVDEIGGFGWIHGKHSGNVSLTGTATWSGEDNFLGVDLARNHLGALLRADANLRYTFGDRPNLNLRVNNFEAHYSDGGVTSWHDHSSSSWGDFSYDMDCSSDGCSGESAEAKWYRSDAGDPVGWIGGVVSDRSNAYAGSFVAEKD